MNPTLAQLAHRAGITVNAESAKFAELIVQECIAMADDFECDVNQRGLVDRMKQHFGVK